MLLLLLSGLAVSETLAQTLTRLTFPKQGSDQAGTILESKEMATTYPIISYTVAYTEPFLIDDLRYPEKTCFNIRTLTVYRASRNGVPLDNQPVVFFVHGGGWTDGYADQYEFVSHSFTGEMGWVTVVIDYRLTSDQVLIADPVCQPTVLAPGDKAAWYPDNIQDVATAFQWTVDHIAGYGGNPNQIVVLGHSAGGHLASFLATHPAYASIRPAIKGVVSMSGVYSVKDLNMTIFWPVVDQTWRGGHKNNDAELDEGSPSTYVTATASLPPFYLLHCQWDLPSLPEQTVMFQNKLDLLGFAVSHDYLLGYDHVSEMAAIGFITETPTALIVDFIRDTLWPYETYLPLIARQ
jgi:acetyl esterase/lipase